MNPQNYRKMRIAVDFDGTIVEHKYPDIGAEIPFAIKTLKMLQEEGYQLILWTVREGCLLDKAVDYCHKKGLDFYAVNANYPGERSDCKNYSRKIKADLLIDNISLGGLPDWGDIYKMIIYKISISDLLEATALCDKSKKKRWFGLR